MFNRDTRTPLGQAFPVKRLITSFVETNRKEVSQSCPTVPPERFTLTIEAVADPLRRPAAIRLRLALKHLLRVQRLRCTAIAPALTSAASEDSGHTDRPDDSGDDLGHRGAIVTQADPSPSTKERKR